MRMRKFWFNEIYLVFYFPWYFNSVLSTYQMQTYNITIKIKNKILILLISDQRNNFKIVFFYSFLKVHLNLLNILNMSCFNTFIHF